MTEERKHWTETSVEKIRELIDNQICDLEKQILEKSHILKHSHLYKTDGGSEINNIADFKWEISFLKDILIHIDDTIKHFIKEEDIAREELN